MSVPWKYKFERDQICIAALPGIGKRKVRIVGMRINRFGEVTYDTQEVFGVTYYTMQVAEHRLELAPLVDRDTQAAESQQIALGIGGDK